MALGTISLQANDPMDVFHVALVHEEGIETSDEQMLLIEDADFDSARAWVNGNVPRFTPVHISGSTATIQGWFKSDVFYHPHSISIYIECEFMEELVKVNATDQGSKEDRNVYADMENEESNEHENDPANIALDAQPVFL